MLTEIKNKIVPVRSLVDETFDDKKTAGYQLALQIGINGITLIVKDIQKNKYIALENYDFRHVYDFDTVVDLSTILLKESKLLPHKYKLVTCLIVNNLSTIVPAPLFEESKKTAYLKFNTAVYEDDSVLVDDIKNLDAKNIFAIPNVLKAKLASLYSKIDYHHFSSVLIESLLLQNKNQTIKKLFVYIQPSHFEAIVIEGKKLLFYNTFNYFTAEDFIYYLLFVCEQLQLNPETIETVLVGEIEKTSELYSAAYKYIRNIQFGERTDDADYSYQLQALPKHFYFTLFNNYL